MNLNVTDSEYFKSSVSENTIQKQQLNNCQDNTSLHSLPKNILTKWQNWLNKKDL